MTAERSVSVLGLGQMGSALARAYVTAGWKAIVWNRSAAKAGPLVAKGAIAAKSATRNQQPNVSVQVASSLLTCLLDQKALHEIFANVSPHPDNGTILVDFTSGTPVEIQKTQQMINNLNISYIRAIVCTTPPYVGNPDTSLYHSGNSEAFKAISDDIGVLEKPR